MRYYTPTPEKGVLFISKFWIWKNDYFNLMKAIPVELKSIDLCNRNSSLPEKFYDDEADDKLFIHFLSPSNMWPERVRATPHTTMVIPTAIQLWYLSGEMNVIQFCISDGLTMTTTWLSHIMGLLSITLLRLSVMKSPEILKEIEFKQVEKK